MRVGLYNETAVGGLGGAEIALAVLAEALSRDREAELHHDPTLSSERLAQASGTNLDGVRLRHVQHDPSEDALPSALHRKPIGESPPALLAVLASLLIDYF